MPILAYETSGLRKKMSKAVGRVLRRKEIVEKNTDTCLLRAYLDDAGSKPLHCRRTLDQFSYYMLDTTESRDRDQVLWRWGRKKLEKAAKAGRTVRGDDAPVLMVDQLWMWVLHDGEFILAFEVEMFRNRSSNADSSVKRIGLYRLTAVFSCGLQYF